MTEHEQSVQYINEYIARARAAQAEFEKMTGRSGRKNHW